MNFVENNGKKVAAILCVASAFPVVATIYAQETAEGWHGNTYVNQDKKVAKGWTEIDGKSYYFDQNGQLDSKKSYNASAATVSTSLKDDVKASVTKSAKASVEEDTAAQTASVNSSDVQAANEVSDITTAKADTTTTETPVEAAAPAEANALEVTNVNQQDTGQAPATEVADTNESETPAQPTQPTGEEAPAQTGNETPAQSAETNTTTPAADENKAADTNNNASQATTTTDNSKQAETKTATEQKTTTTTTTTATASSNDTSQYASLNAAIAAAALSEVGTTDGQQCTEVVTQALNSAGVDASVVWPAEYVQYGHYVSADQAVAGNLIYYANGGAGYAHIAVYIGNGQAVQGNFDGKTVVAAADLASYGTGASQAQYIQVTG